MMAGSQAGQLQIGHVAQTVGVTARTLRFYERIGLLSPPVRTASGYRLYGQEEVDRVRFILRAKEVGLSLEEVHQVLAIRDSGQSPCVHVRQLIEGKLVEIRRQVSSLMQLERELDQLKHNPPSPMNAGACVCGIIEGVTESSQP